MPSPGISQLLSVSYPLVLAEMRKATNQWADSAFLTEMEKQGFIKHKPLGATIECPLDYQRNPGTVIQATDLQTLSLTKTDVISSATYDIAEVVSPITWSMKDEVTNPSQAQKVDLVKGLLENGINSHDDILEDKLLETTTNGLLGLGTHVPTSGQGTDGGISAVTYSFWRNQASTYVDDADIESAFTTVHNNCSKGSGSKLQPTLMVSDGATNALFEGSQQALQRYESQDFKAGAKTLMFKTSKYVFSQYAGTSVYFLNPKSLQLVVAKSHFRLKGDTITLPNQTGYTTRIYSALQLVTDNKSRLGVAYVA